MTTYGAAWHRRQERRAGALDVELWVPGRICPNCLRPEPCGCSDMGGERATFLDASHAGWVRAWAELSRRWGSPVCLDPETRDSWQYMGTYRGAHYFRHRRLYAPGHAQHGQRVSDDVAVEPGDFAIESPAFTPGDGDPKYPDGIDAGPRVM